MIFNHSVHIFYLDYFLTLHVHVNWPWTQMILYKILLVLQECTSFGERMIWVFLYYVDHLPRKLHIAQKLLGMATKQFYHWMSWYYYFYFFFTWTIIFNLIPLAVLSNSLPVTIYSYSTYSVSPSLAKKNVVMYLYCKSALRHTQEVQWPQMLMRKPQLLSCSQVQCTWDLPVSTNESRFSYHHSLYPNLAKWHCGHIRSVT